MNKTKKLKSNPKKGHFIGLSEQSKLDPETLKIYTELNREYWHLFRKGRNTSEEILRKEEILSLIDPIKRSIRPKPFIEPIRSL